MYPTELEIQDLKAKYPGALLLQVDIKTDDDKEVCYILKEPKRSVIDAMASSDKTEGGDAASKTLIANCVVWGNLDLIENSGNVYLTLLSRCKEVVKKYQSTIKKL